VFWDIDLAQPFTEESLKPVKGKWVQSSAEKLTIKDRNIITND
jgi:hypothetical protein